MLKKTITYKDFENIERTEDFYFNLTKAELTEMDICYDGGLKAMIEKIASTKDNTIVLEIFKDVIRKSYGEKSLDGRRFMKSKEITDSFTSTGAYSELFMEFLEKPESAAEFINAVVASATQN